MNYNSQQQAYPPPGTAYPIPQGQPYPPPPPQTYPSPVGYPQQVLVETTSHGNDGFLKGCLAAMCCCCLLEACF